MRALTCLTVVVSLPLLIGAAPPRPPVQYVPEATGQSQVDDQTTQENVTITDDDAQRMTVPVSVIGKGPYRFLVDTGSERTVISRELAKRLQLQAGINATLHSVIGANQVQTVQIPRLKVSSNDVRVIDAPALLQTNIGADGMLGIDSLKAQRVLFDFKARTMSISPSAAPAEAADGDAIVVRARSRHGRLVFTHAEIDGQQVTVIVDTGSQFTIGNSALQRRLARRNIVPLPGVVKLESVTGESMNVRVAKVRELELGGIKLADIAIAFTDAHIFRKLELDRRPALLLGMNAMRAFDQISIDFAAKKVRFVLPESSMRGGTRMAAR